MGVAVVEETSEYKEPDLLHETLYVPSKLVVTENNECFHGNDATDKEKAEPICNLKYSWNIGGLITSNKSSKWRNENTDTKHEKSTSPLLPLALFFSAIKHKVEAERGVIIGRLLVSIPLWIPCFIREIMLEAAVLSGFEPNECHLFNEASSAAFHIFMTNQFEVTCNAVVISENASTIDRSVYVFNESLQELLLCYHSSNELTKAKDQAYIRSATSEDRITNTQTQSKAYVPIENFLHVQNLIKQICDNEYKMYEMSRVIIIFDSENAEKVIADNISGMTSALISDKATIHGLSNILCTFIKKNKPSIDYFLGETSNMSLEVMQNDIQVFATHNFIWKYETVQSIEIPCNISKNQNTSKYLDFYQIMPHYKCLLGSLKIIENPQWPATLNKIKMHFVCKHGGVFNLNEISYISDKNVEKYIVGKCYTWSSTNVTEEQVCEEKRMYVKIRDQNVLHKKLNIYMENIMQLGQKLIKDVNEGKGDFRTPIGRALVQKNVSECIETLKTLQLDIDGLKERQDLFISIKEKYKL